MQQLGIIDCIFYFKGLDTHFVSTDLDCVCTCRLYSRGSRIQPALEFTESSLNSKA